MVGVRALVQSSGVPARLSMPGDIVIGSENISAGSITTVGNGTITGSQIVNGLILRSGPTAAFNDTYDSALGILTALGGNADSANVVSGSTFRVRVINTTAFVQSFTRGTGVIAGLGFNTLAAGTWRDFVFTVVNTTPLLTVAGTTLTGDPNVTFSLPTGMTSLPYGPGYGAYNISPGATIVGTGIPVGATVLSITPGASGLVGVVMSVNATATGTVQVSFGPTLTVDSIGSGTV